MYERCNSISQMQKDTTLYRAQFFRRFLAAQTNYDFCPNSLLAMLLSVEGLYCKRLIQSSKILTPHPLASVYCVPPRLWCGGRTNSWVERGWGVNILEDARHCTIFYIRKYFVLLSHVKMITRCPEFDTVVPERIESPGQGVLIAPVLLPKRRDAFRKLEKKAKGSGQRKVYYYLTLCVYW